MQFLPIHAEAVFDKAGRENLAQLRTASGATEENFNKLYLPQLRVFSQWVQELPLEADNFNQPLGAFRFGMTSAWLALRLSDQVIFVQGQSHERRNMDPQYRFAAFCGCLASTVLLVQHHLNVTVQSKPWSYLSAVPNLHERLLSTPGSQYEVGWTRNQKRPGNALSVLVLGKFFHAGMWEGFHPAVCSDLGIAINPGCLQIPGEMPLSKVVRQGMEKAREIEAKGRAAQYTPPTPATTFDLSDAVMPSAMSLAPSSLDVPDVTDDSGDADQSPEAVAPAKPELSKELQAFTAHIRANKAIQEKLEISLDGTMIFDAKFLKGAGVEAQKVYEWLKNAGFIVEVRNEAPRHLVLSAAIAKHMKVEA